MTGKPATSRLLPVLVALVATLGGCQLPPRDSTTSTNSVAGPSTLKGSSASLVLTPSAGSSKNIQAVGLPPPSVTLLSAPQVVEIDRDLTDVNPVVTVDRSPQQQASALMPAAARVVETKGLAASIEQTTSSEVPPKPRPYVPVFVKDENSEVIIPAAANSVPATSSNTVTPAAAAVPAVETPAQTQEPPIRPATPASTNLPSIPAPSSTSSQPTVLVPPTEVKVSPVQATASSSLPGVPVPPAPATTAASTPAPLPSTLTTTPQTSAVTPGPISLGGQSISFESLAKMVDGGVATAGAEVGCASCGDCGPGRPCTPGSQKCEPFPDGNFLTRMAGIVYEVIVCPDPCYEPHWEPIADSAFYVDSPRPVSNTRFQWDAVNHFAYPDRAEYFWAAQPKGPAPTDSLKAIPYINYNQLMLVTEIATGAASVAVAMPYRSWDGEPYAHSAAGFSDMSITAKSLVLDTELFLCAFQMKTYIPIGNPTNGLGDGHVSLEPGLVFGIRLAPETYVQAEIQEWIPLGGDPNSQGAFLQWGLSLNQILWQPVRDVKLIGTLELTGYSFQAGQYTDPVLGPTKLSGENNVSIANGYRMFFGRFDIGVAGQFGITGKYMARDAMQLDLRFRY